MLRGMKDMSKQKSLGINAVLNGLRTILNMIFPLITFPYVSRVLQVENLGKYNFAYSVNSYFLLIAGLGISTYAIREGAKFRDKKKEFSQFASEIFSINIISTVIAYLLLFFCIAIVPQFQSYTIVILVFSIEIAFTTLGTEWVFSIFEEYTYITIRSIFFKIISIVLLFVLVREPDDYIIYAGITVFSNAGSNILNFFRVRKYCNLRLTLKCNWKDHLKPILVIFGSLATTSIYVNSDTTMLGLMTTDYEVGIYSVASKIYRIVKQMLSAVLIVSIPRLALLMGQQRYTEYRRTLTQIFNILTILLLPAVTGLILLSREVVLVIASPEYIQTTTSLQLLSIALIFCIFGWIFNQCVLIPAKKEMIVLKATIISAIANIFLNFILIPIWKENAAALSTIVAEAIMMVVCMYNGLKVTRLEKGVFKNMISVIVGCVIIVIICKIIQSLNLSILLTMCISIVLSVVGYICTLLILKNVTIVSIVKSINKRKNNRYK